jgi:DNA (cytosine-5)-methyltransferase 1
LKTPHGFNDRVSGTLFFEIASILEHRKPDAFLLENVRNLERHDSRRTFREIIQTLENDLKYSVSYRVLDASLFLPQHRPRIYIVGFREPNDFSFDNLQIPKSPKSLKSVLTPNSRVDGKYTLSTNLWSYLQNYAKKHREAGNGFGFGLISRESDTRTRTLSARYHKDGSEILISRGPRRNPRRLTPRECARLMGFPDDFKIPVSDTQAYRQFGNSVAVPVVESIAREIRRCLK